MHTRTTVHRKTESSFCQQDNSSEQLEMAKADNMQNIYSNISIKLVGHSLSVTNEAVFRYLFWSQ